MNYIKVFYCIGTFFSALAFVYSLARLKKRKSSLAKITSNDPSVYFLKKTISRDELGVIEASIKNLSDIFVPCERVDKPKGTLLEAVESNMNRGVRYTFLVSPDNYYVSEGTYYQYFLAVAKSVSWKSKNLCFDDLIRIRPLRKEWQFYPHIFYKTEEDSNGLEATIVYRGNEKGVGLCKNYTLLDPDDAIMSYHYLMESAVIWSDKDKEIFKLIFSVEENEFVEHEIFAKNNFPRLAVGLERRAI